MAPYQQRVIDEETALINKITKLLTFPGSPLYHDLEQAEQDLLQRQYKAMQKYSDVLAERIAAFNQGASQ